MQGISRSTARMVESKGRSVFELEPPSPAWARDAQRLCVAETSACRRHGFGTRQCQGARRRFPQPTHGGRTGVSAEPAVVARRLISFLSQSPLILDGADHDFYRRFMRTLGRSTTQLLQAMAGPLTGEDRLPVAIALAYAGLCLAGPARLYNRANALLAVEIKAQILPDGAHISRNPPHPHRSAHRSPAATPDLRGARPRAAGRSRQRHRPHDADVAPVPVRLRGAGALQRHGLDPAPTCSPRCLLMTTCGRSR